MSALLSKLEQRPISYLILAYAVAFVPTTALGYLFRVVLNIQRTHLVSRSAADAYENAIGAVTIGPVIETLMMVFVFFILRFFLKTRVTLVAASAIIWALLHSLSDWSWGLLIFWPFCVFSFTFLFWDQKRRTKALLMTMVLHAMFNAVGALNLLFEASALK